MSVYAFEMKRQWKSALSWTVLLLAILCLLMTFFFPLYMSSKADVQAIFDRFPPEFAAAFGVNADDIFSYPGFYGFLFLYLSVCGSIMASGLGITTFGREKRNKCTDFLLTKPQTRSQVFLAKALANLTLLLAFCVCFVAASLLLYHGSGETGLSNGQVFLAAFSLFLLQLFFWAFGLLVATLAKKIRSASGMSMAIGFGSFVLLALYRLTEEEKFRILAPLTYYTPSEVFSSGGFEAPYALTGAVLTLVFLIIAYVSYCRCDVHAV